MSTSSKVIKNTGFLYAKMLISMFIALYSTRIVLDALGTNDFGVFNLVAGVIAMLTFLRAAMATATQRYLSYYLGAKASSKLNSVFKSSVVLHLIIGVLLVILLEIIGIFLFGGFLNIPESRISSAKIVYHFMVVSAFFTINAVPYDALIISHEAFFFEAIVGILESFLKLVIAFALSYSVNDRLVLYGILMACLMILVRIVKGVYCFRQFAESRSYRKSVFDLTLSKEMFSFAGWNMFGALCGMGRSQGLAIILNLFFGTIVNAAYGIANQINAQLATFSQNMLKALNPQIIKSEGSGDRQRMLYLSMMASKYGFFLLAFFSVPLIFEMPFVLSLWLKDVPRYTVIFCQLSLVSTLANQLTIGLQTAIQSTGTIKMYQTVVGSLLLFNLPVSWVLLVWGFEAYSVLVSMVCIELIACLFRLYFLKRVAGLRIEEYFSKVILKILLVTVITVGVTFLFYINFSSGFVRFFLLVVVSSVTFGVSFYFIGASKTEKVKFLDALLKLIAKLPLKIKEK